MSQITSDCPRCGATKTTFDVLADINVGRSYDWMSHHEVFSKCRHCHAGVIFKLDLNNAFAKKHFLEDGSIANLDGSANDMFNIQGPLTNRDVAAQRPPHLVPPVVANVYAEGASSLVAGCYNAAGAMFRLALDITTKSLLPNEEENPQPNRDQRSQLAARLDWLFKHDRMPKGLEKLAECVRHDGNDAAHDGTLTKDEAADLLDFTTALLERVFTEPGRLRVAEERREARRMAAREGDQA